MDHRDSSSLLAVLQQVPDPRKRQGRSYAWPYLLALLAAAVVGGQEHAMEITCWLHAHRAELLTLLKPAKQRLPSYATIRRVLLHVSVEALEAAVSWHNTAVDAADPTVGQVVGADGSVWRGQAIDGKTIRTASAYGKTVHLVSLVRHGSGYVLAQAAVADKSNEITAVPALLVGRAGPGTVTTMDALLTQRQDAETILAQGGHYLMVVKKNQGHLYEAIDLLFREPPPQLRGEQDVLSWTETSHGHGRDERRTIESSVALNDYLDWPGVGQVLRRIYHSVQHTTGKTSHEVTYAILSLERRHALPEHAGHFWRGHWTIENPVHYVRDETFGEDRGHIHTGTAPQVLAALRNAVLTLLRYRGWTNIAAALRHYSQSPQEALHLIGAIAT